MFDFDFHNPTKIIFGRGKESRLGTELQRDGIRKVLFLYGKQSIKASGLYDRIVKSLRGADIAWVEHAGVASNPVLSHARSGVALARERQVDAVLAVGGGSVLDEGKAIAVGALADDDLWSFFVGKQVSAALPVYTVLTLAATGSEMNGNAVVTNEESKQKYNISSPLVYPRVSILNPELTCSVPLDYSAYGAVDAIAHVIEGYFTRKEGSHLQDRLVESIIKTVIETANVIMTQPTDYQARAEFMWAATLALNGLTTAGLKEYTFPNHMIEHSLSALYNIAHGAGLAIVIPAWMKWYAPRCPDRFERFAKEVFGLTGAEEGIVALEKWFASIKAPVRLGEAGIASDDIEMIAENAFGLASQWGIAGLYPRHSIAEILRLAC